MFSVPAFTLPKGTRLMTILIIVLIALVAFLGFAATRPDAFRIERGISIKAAPEKIFALLNDFRQWSGWSPWEKLDPEMKRTHSGAASGKGAVYAWEANKKVGAGRMEITDTTPPSRLAIKLDFIRPFEAHNTVEFSLKGAGDSTHISWAMIGANDFMGKVMSIFMNMDKLVGKDFETGLANLKALAEK
jgi:uncharacterized protein YndB with AHSA1/START domain